MGEALTALPVWRRLKAASPATPIVLTCTSPSSRRWPGGWPVDRADFLPPDQPGPIRVMLETLRPRLLAFSRADVWPELTWAALERGVPVALIGAAVRPGSGRLRWPVRGLLRPLYQRIAYAAAASRADAPRLARLGVRQEALAVTGDPRHDQVLERVPDWRAVRPLAAWATPGQTLVAGSTDPKDETLLLEALPALLVRWPAARLLLCPHQPGPRRTEWLTALARRVGLVATSWREGPLQTDAPLVMVERVGVLADLYLLGALAYVGGGLASRGVHAVIEPAACAVPVIVGPRGRAADVTGLLAAGGAVALPAGNSMETLVRLWDSWLDDAPARERAGLAARAALATGAAQRTADRLLKLLADG